METNDLRKAVKHINQTAVTTVEEGIQKLLEQVPDNTGMKVSMVHLRHDEAGKLCGVKLSLESPVVFEDAQDLTDSSKAAMGGEPYV